MRIFKTGDDDAQKEPVSPGLQSPVRADEHDGGVPAGGGRPVRPRSCRRPARIDRERVRSLVNTCPVRSPDTTALPPRRAGRRRKAGSRTRVSRWRGTCGIRHYRTASIPAGGNIEFVSIENAVRLFNTVFDHFAHSPIHFINLHLVQA